MMKNLAGLRSSRVLGVRFTSAGPPPSDPPKPGSLMFKYEQFVGKWPKILALHKTVMNGSRWCFSDVKTYYKTRKSLMSGEKKLADLSVEQLETLVQSGSELAKMIALMIVIQIPGPGDLLILMLEAEKIRHIAIFGPLTSLIPIEGPKMAIVCVLAPMPLTVYLFGFAVIFFPRLVLTRHFWSDEQRREFFQLEVTKALINGEQLLKEVSVETVKPADQLETAQLFLLHGLHSMYLLPGSTNRIQKRIEALRSLDSLIPLEIEQMNERQLIFNCYIRKIDIGSKNKEQLKTSLLDYVKFTSRMPNSTYLYASALFKKNLN
ncbi:unnamed protein product [Caenorhabditis angaria]|uniref:Letm1 RBD domain-containing protein n=1 Tax=Caenorhabditis angaria TaxID=860376 RepID=A0A9P1I642_9PELO|nr:unnamed protein product [Caenorhabditis angaria]